MQHELKNVTQIQASWNGAFAALLENGSVVSWGDATAGGDCSSVARQLKDVQQIQSSGFAFAAIRADGSVVTWGADHAGGDSRSVRDQLCDVQQVQGTNGAMAAILADGTLVTWGDAGCGGDSSSVQDRLPQRRKGQLFVLLGRGCVYV